MQPSAESVQSTGYGWFSTEMLYCMYAITPAYTEYALHLHIALPDMMQYYFFTLGILGAHPSDRAAFAKMAPAFVISSKFTNSSYLRFPTFFTGIFITLPHSSHFLPIYEKKVPFR